MSDRQPGSRLFIDVFTYAAARLALVAAVTAVIVGLGYLIGVAVPVVVALLFAIVIALPLGMWVFTPLRRRATASIAAVDERRRNIPRTAAYDGIQDALSGYDVLMTPTLTVPPYSKQLSEGYPAEIDGESVMGVPTDMMLTWVFNLSGHPAASAPAGFSDGGLPIGVQIIGRRFSEADILSVVAALERARPWSAQYDE